MADLTSYKVPPPAPVTLYGRDLILEPYNTQKHLAGLWSTLGGATGINTLLQYFPNDTFHSPSDLDAWLIQANTSLGYVTLVAIANSTHAVLGMASYMRPDSKNGVVEVGAIAHGPALAGTRAATELHYVMARHVFEDLRYRRYEWKCHDENTPSKRAAVRYGFVFEGVFRQHMISRGRNRDTAWFSIIDGEWPVVKGGFERWLDDGNFDEQGKQRRKLEDIRRDLVEVERSKE